MANNAALIPMIQPVIIVRRIATAAPMRNFVAPEIFVKAMPYVAMASVLLAATRINLVAPMNPVARPDWFAKKINALPAAQMASHAVPGIAACHKLASGRNV